MGLIRNATDCGMHREIVLERLGPTIDLRIWSYGGVHPMAPMPIVAPPTAVPNVLSRFLPIGFRIPRALSKSPSVLKGEECRWKSQVKISIGLSALGSGITELLRWQQAHPPDAGVS
ncbi:hypothetical protein EAI_01452 [Harpegnathos saltator]|uniref:Uncharacterized protein n=1 Tax=Harpegnathos saltator TaxID=610380 RepID=E2BMG6_HARSA|nr:hypothetical protein EAI_01452 [Harpegnathos saltator]